ncbi:LysR family transcriptional regulator [Ramlibacter sp. XY19]|uniref:LysR family transcriptional regulator n=1 Tax=Ramlibacter paludis TaxID=2908000 RepID=UPI0023DABB2B|nr:LysR family transcriptional regulator [Ramlibacter paludis]MCG2594012.1 LysR family transcriptional regulator [Ramlibacter paludis]
MHKLQFDELALFARVADLGSLSAVARERDVPVSQVSRALDRLEQACGAKLLRRSTHGLSLTEEGRTFLAYSRRAVDALEELQGQFAEHAGEPSGVVRVAASTIVAQYQLVPSLPGLAQRHPRIAIDLEVGDRLLDLARDGIDIAIRTSNSLPDTVVARQIGTLGRALYAAPAYAKAHGLPAAIGELSEHRLVSNNTVPSLNDWPFVVDGSPQRFAAQGHWRANDTGMAAAMVLEGLGIGRLATLVGDGLVKQGLLVTVLADCVDLQPVPVYAVTAGTRQRLPKIKACLDYWTEWFAK